MEALFVPLSLLAGALLAVQAGANTQLSKATGSAFAATTIQVVIAGTLLVIVAAVTGTVFAFGSLPAVPWWHAIGGIATAIYVASTILLFPRLGAVVTVGLFIAGQMFASLALDAFGVLGVPRQTPEIAAMIGTFAVLVGAAAIVFGQRAPPASSPSRSSDGSCLRFSPAPSCRSRARSTASCAATSVRRSWWAPSALPSPRCDGGGAARHAHPDRCAEAAARGLAKMPWWGWLGAFCGATYVTTVFTAIPMIGTAAAVGLTVAGQQIASLFVDRYGWFRLPKREISPPARRRRRAPAGWRRSHPGLLAAFEQLVVDRVVRAGTEPALDKR